MLNRRIYELFSISSSAIKVAREASGLVAKEVEDALKTTKLLQPLRNDNALWQELRAKSDEAKGVKEFQGSEIVPDIYQLAHEKSVVAAATAAKHPSKSKRSKSASKTIKNERGFHTMSRIRNEDNFKKPKVIGEAVKPEFEMSQSAVPSTRIGRLFHYGALAAGIGLNMAAEGAKKYATSGTAPDIGSLMLSPANIERMAKKFSRMRGAALKIGQMLSFQDSSVLPKEIQQILLRVQNNAHYMPAGQLEKVMKFELGDDWRVRMFSSFEDVPIAAASIGQVHGAITKDLEEVVVKVQYPGVADSIDSDLNNLLLLLTASKLLPPGLFLENSVDNARMELKWECDYIREAQSLDRFRELLKDDEVFVVPKVYHELSGEHVLTMQRLKGTEIVKGDWSQERKDWIATNIMRLCLMEIAQFRFMQSDPNWANFLCNESTNKIELLDFGASREYSKEFIDNYLGCLRAAILKDRKGAYDYSLKLGYLTGLESEAMVKAHVDSMLVLGEPFAPKDNSGNAYNFTQQTVTDRVRGNISLMLNERLSPPPEETYSLHRKLSGAYLLCARLNATVPCQKLFEEIVGF
ncbi:unnamed protein product [Kuraishia capsulata CBS 1993]|uniref:ABC1 atypical kinase-like domain-containing protein n=1 Tax=Kuraishia capsulata CBS 1993 TaxID=1382522 RepID=W6MIE1_9ASCO|nr:uncharacterized protein KUCA_T00001623001 [Kuraishia capsulata CBS 1993]CDK25653.1 unnamed protein product [Kuraishia capsulata CBS 1993]